MLDAESNRLPTIISCLLACSIWACTLAHQLVAQQHIPGCIAGFQNTDGFFNLCCSLSLQWKFEGLVRWQAHPHSSVKHGIDQDALLGNLLLQMYGSCGALEDACWVFNSMQKRDQFSWNFMIRVHA